jgi:acetaldehyde dehydrogenase / alcohol dehydrogenase
MKEAKMGPTMSATRVLITPKQILFGRGSVQALEKIPGKKALIITDQTMVKVGAVEKVEGYLKKAGLMTQIFAEVPPEYSLNIIVKMVEQNKSFAPDVIIGLGGGSAIDAAKAFRVFYEHPGLGLKDIFPVSGPPLKSIPPFTKTTFIAIPTTSGTGSEASPVIVVSDPDNCDKPATGSPYLLADKSILDPDFTDSLPRVVQIDSGFDALSHAIPAYYSNFGTDFSKALALQAMRLVMQYLSLAAQGDKLAKEHMHYAACQAGMAFTNSGLGVEHYIGHIYGAKFHISHGRTCAIVLPHCIQFNATAAKDSILEMASSIGYAGGQDGAADYLITRINNLKKELGVPDSLREQGISESIFKAELPGFIAKFNNNPNLPPLISNPQKCTAENMTDLYNKTYYGS